MRTTISEAYARHKQTSKLLLYVVLTLVPAVFLADMLSRAFTDSGLKLAIWALLSLVGLDAISLASFLFGGYLGLLGLLYVDFKKRAQSIILGAATLIGVVGLALRGLFLPTMSLVDLGLVAVGVVVGVIVGGGHKLRYIEINNAMDLVRGRIVTSSGRVPLEFEDAERLLYQSLVALMIIGFVEAHLSYPPPFRLGGGGSLVVDPGAILSVEFVRPLVVQDLVAMSFFSVALWLFLGYDTERRLFILGPPGSGKTHVPAGMYIAADRANLPVWGSSEGLDSLIAEIKEAGDFAGRTDIDEEGVRDTGFRYAQTGYFPKNVIVDALDYPGELLPHIPVGIQLLRGAISEEEAKAEMLEQMLSGEATKDDLHAAAEGTEMADGGDITTSEPSAPEPSSPETVDAPDLTDDEADYDDETQRRVDRRFDYIMEDILPRVVRADTLLLVLDMERYERDKRMYTTYYNRMIDELSAATDSPSARVRSLFSRETSMGPLKAEKAIATKSDMVLEGFGRSAAETMGAYESFREFVHNSLNNDIEVGPLIGAIGSAPYPVFIKGRDGDRTTMDLGPDGAPILFGFRELLERLSR